MSSMTRGLSDLLSASTNHSATFAASATPSLASSSASCFARVVTRVTTYTARLRDPAFSGPSADGSSASERVIAL